MFFKNLKILILKKAQPHIHNPMKNIIYDIPSPHILANNRTISQFPNRFYSSSANIEKVEMNPDPSLRMKREEFSEPCKFCLIPDAWFRFFHQKTGVTGFYTFIVTFGTFLCSKEIYVMEHEFYTGLSMLILCFLAVRYIGPDLSKWLDKEIDHIESEWTAKRTQDIENMKLGIEFEKDMQWSEEGQLVLLQAKRENVLMQLEYNYRKRKMTVYNRVIRLMNLQIALDNIHKRFGQRNMMEWITKQVMKEMTAEREHKCFEACLMEIGLAAEDYAKIKAIEAAKEKE